MANDLHQVIGIKQLAGDIRFAIWRVSFNGTVYGDSRGYSKVQAIQEARNLVARDPHYRTLDETNM